MSEWSRILDAKGPHVHSDGHNPERDNPGTQAAPLPSNDPNGTTARLLRLAQQFEDQHAPQDMTLLLREVAARIVQLEAALRWVSLQHYTDQRTVTPEIAHQAYRPLIAHVNAICDKARAALGDERT